MNRTILFACLLLAPLPVRAADVECHTGEIFSVAVETYDDEPGARFAVSATSREPKDKTCRFDPSQAEFIIGEKGDPLWFGALKDRFLVLTRSTGPQGDLVVHDLAARKKVLDVPADEFEIDGQSLIFWQRGEAASADNCPTFTQNEANGMGSVLATGMVLDLASGKIAETGETRCQATQ